MSRVLITGASGFVGRALCDVLVRSGYLVRAAVRDDTRIILPSVSETVVVGDIGSATDWSRALDDVQLVIHTAARAHIMGDSVANNDLYREVNARGTARLARAAAQGGVRRFVYMSSVKVNGERTNPDTPYTPCDPPRPEDVYGISKWEGEQRLLDVAGGTSLEAAIIRAPLVYGPSVRANFLRLLSWVDRGIPLPLGLVRNRRSLVSIWTLTDLLLRLLSHPKAAGGIWMVSDGEDVSTPELIRRIGRVLHRPSRLVPIPIAMLRIAGAAIGRSDEVARLCGSLVVDISATCRELSWSPPLSLNESLERTAAWYRSTRSPSIIGGGN